MASEPTKTHLGRGEFRSGPIAGTALISAATFNRNPVHYADVEGWAIFEGDIVIGRVADIQRAQARGEAPVPRSIGITGQQFRWPNATIPFTIDAGMPDQHRVTDAIAHWQANTPIRFVPHTAADADFVTFQAGNGCSSAVGRQGGQQFVTLGADCTTGNAIHEIGHTVGLWHEQSRQDRDTFVQIVFGNIDPALQHNFTQHTTDGDDLGAYDYGSVMHYPPDAFSMNGKATIIALQPIPAGVTMGQRDGLSAGDIAGVLILYPPPPITRKEVVKDAIADTLKEARKDPIQDTIKELRKDPIADTLKEIRKDPIRDTVKEVRGDPTIAETIFQPGPGPVVVNPLAIPFVMAGGSQFGGGSFDQSSAISEVQALAEAILANEQQMAELQQQHADLVAAYQAALNAAGGQT
jgi:hypothetical protein